MHPKRRRWPNTIAAAMLAATTGFVASALPIGREARAISIELKDVAPDRIERQRANADNRLPLPNTPDLSRLKERLEAAGVKSGSPVMLRIFKESSELELWIEKGESFVLFATYPICHWSGTLGPKQREGDKQTPEGFYAASRRQLHHLGRWPSAIDIGFPNAFDEANKRDGSYILMHGGCSSVGCFAMTDAVIKEVYGLANAAIGAGQRYVPIHIMPFRMTDAAMTVHASNPWAPFWRSLKAGYDSFERTRRPPRISVCNAEYVVEDAEPKSAEALAAATAGRKRDRSAIVIGAIRKSCPEPQLPGSSSLTAGATPSTVSADAGKGIKAR